MKRPGGKEFQDPRFNPDPAVRAYANERRARALGEYGGDYSSGYADEDDPCTRAVRDAVDDLRDLTELMAK